MRFHLQVFSCFSQVGSNASECWCHSRAKCLALLDGQMWDHKEGSRNFEDAGSQGYASYINICKYLHGNRIPRRTGEICEGGDGKTRLQFSCNFSNL